MLEHMVCVSATSNGRCDCSKVTASLGPIYLELGILDIHYLFHCEVVEQQTGSGGSRVGWGDPGVQRNLPFASLVKDFVQF